MLVPTSFVDGQVPHGSDLTFLLDMPRCQVAQIASGTATSCPDGVLTPIAFDTNIYDNDTMHSTSTFTTRIVINTAGTWDFNCYWAGPAATYTVLNLNPRVNAAGVGTGGISVRTHPFGAGVQAGRMSFTRQFIAGDYVELFVLQTSGAARVSSQGNNVTGVTATWRAL